VKPKLYIETSIVSYLTARPSRDVVINANQQLAQEWWESRQNFELFVSQLVVDEASKGDAAFAQKRLDLIKDLPLIDFNADAKNLAKEILRQNVLPAKAALDVFHNCGNGCSRIRFLANFELQAYCQRLYFSAHRKNLFAIRLSSPDCLHAARDFAKGE